MVNAALAQTLIRAVDEADSSDKLLDAVQRLADSRLEEGIPTLIAALSYNNPGAAVAAVDGLILIGKPAVLPLLDLLDQHNYTARAWAVRALAGIGDPRGLEILLDAAKTDFAMSVRRAAARGLGTILWHEMPSHAIGGAQESVLEVLWTVAQDPDWVVRYAAVTGLRSLAEAATATVPELVPQIIHKLEHLVGIESDLCVRTRIQFAQYQLRDQVGAPMAIAAGNNSETTTSTTPSNLDDWRQTLERLYNRKSQERSASSLPEGDPRRYHQLASAIAPTVLNT